MVTSSSSQENPPTPEALVKDSCGDQVGTGRCIELLIAEQRIGGLQELLDVVNKSVNQYGCLEMHPTDQSRTENILKMEPVPSLPITVVLLSSEGVTEVRKNIKRVLEARDDIEDTSLTA